MSSPNGALPAQPTPPAQPELDPRPDLVPGAQMHFRGATDDRCWHASVLAVSEPTNAECDITLTVVTYEGRRAYVDLPYVCPDAAAYGQRDSWHYIQDHEWLNKGAPCGCGQSQGN